MKQLKPSEIKSKLNSLRKTLGYYKREIIEHEEEMMDTEILIAYYEKMLQDLTKNNVNPSARNFKREKIHAQEPN